MVVLMVKKGRRNTTAPLIISVTSREGTAVTKQSDRGT